MHYLGLRADSNALQEIDLQPSENIGREDPRELVVQERLYRLRCTENRFSYQAASWLGLPANLVAERDVARLYHVA